MRLRNVLGASDIIDASPYIIKDYQKYKGNFKTIFNNNNDINIEIGMGKGDFIIGMALKNPNVNFIGIEKFDSVMVRAVQKLENINIPNLKLIRMDATNISNVFDKEINTIYLNFSDPWPKKRHSNRRLTSCEFLKKYDSIFCGPNRIIQKTDNRGFFEFSVMSFNNYGYLIDEISLDLYSSDVSSNVQTEYEKKFVESGNIIYMISVHK